MKDDIKIQTEQNNINVVDSIMGSGKTEAIINMINSTSSENKYIVITPYLDEVIRLEKSCEQKKFKTPSYTDDANKLKNIKNLIENNCNIISTHSLFQNFNSDIIDIVKEKNYTLILDEVFNVITDMRNMSSYDMNILKDNFISIDDKTKIVKWHDEYKDYTGYFNKEKNLIDLKCSYYIGNNRIISLFPIDVFKAFKKVYILTYQFKYQIMKYYFDYHNIKYKYLSVSGGTNMFDPYHLVEYDDDLNKKKIDYKSLIHICDHKELNSIGSDYYDLTKNWYIKDKKDCDKKKIKQLKNNILNYFTNIRNVKSKDILWTTFKDYESLLKGKGYSKSFLPLNTKASNEYQDRTSIAYTINRFVNPEVILFFTTINGIKINNNGLALSEMLQFIWRSAIRNKQDIWIYIPSSRMRNLLEKWINDEPI